MRSLLFATAMMVATTTALAGAPATAASKQNAGQLARIVPKWMDAAHIRGAAIAHVRDGRIESVQAFGERAPGVPMTVDAQFNVASLTKPVFATLALQLVAEGKLTLDTRLADHWVDPDVAADVRHLSLTPRLTLSHQSGLPNWRNERLAFDFAPGARHEYSGEGFEYTRRAIERLTGQTMNELMRTRVLERAGMTHTYFGWNAAIPGHEVTGFDTAGKPLDTSGLQQRQANAAANMFTTVGDYARFAQWTIEGADLPRSLRNEMARPQAQHANPSEYFGLGWRLIQVGNETVLSHDGRERGVRTQVFVLPESREALVILTNSDHGELLVNPVVRATLGKGRQLIRQVGTDTWHYLQNVPREQIGPMVQGITRSPSFMSKLLYAVDATLVANSRIDAEGRERAHHLIDPFVLGMVNGKISQETAKEVFSLILEDSSTGPRLRSEFTTAQAGAWLRSLQAAVGKQAG